MNKRTCEWTEQEVIDFVLKNLSPEKSKSFKYHLEDCTTCQKLHHEWVVLTEGPDEEIEPSKDLQNQIKEELYGRQRKWTLPKLKLNYGIAFILFIVISTTGLILNVQQTSMEKIPEIVHEQRNQWQLQPIKISAVKPNPYTPKPIGYIYLNNIEDRMVLYVKGLYDLNQRNYHVWIVSQNKRSRAGTLSGNLDWAKLDYSGEHIKNAKTLIISTTPKSMNYNEQPLKDEYIIKLPVYSNIFYNSGL